MIITVTGTPGTGKTYVAKKLANKNLRYIDLNSMIKKERLYDKYDRKAKTYDVDVKKLKKIEERFAGYKEKEFEVKKIINIDGLKRALKNKKGILIDSHLSHFINSDLCIVVKADIKTISDRLKERKYSSKKIRDNVESEIFDVCLEDAKRLGRNIVVINNG